MKSSVLVLFSVIFISLHCIVNGLTYTAHTDPNDVTAPITGPCGDGKCLCTRKHVATCANWGANLTYIPSLPSSIQKLIFENNSLPIVSRETFQNVTFIKALYLLHNGIFNVTDDAFVDLTTLSGLGIEDDQHISKYDLANAFKSLQNQYRIVIKLTNIGLETLTTDFLKHLYAKNVNSLDVSKNLFEELNLDVINQLEALKNLKVSSCTIRHVDALSGHRTLEELDLSNNSIGYNQPAFCSNYGGEFNFPKLKRLSLRENVIHRFSAANWDCMQRLIYLDISQNFISVLQTNAFAKLRSLTELHMSDMYTGIHEIQKASLNNSHLAVLRLDGNSIRFQPNMTSHMFAYCLNVKVIYLSRNNFYYIGDSDILQIFSPLKYLTELTIESAHMRLPVGFLELFPNLTNLNLASNRNAIYDVGIFFKSTKNLKILSLKDNSIKVVSKESFNGVTMGSIQKLNLADNPFSCSCKMLWFRNAISENGKIGNITLQEWPMRYTCAEHKQTVPLFANYKPTKSSCQNVLLIALISVVSFFVLVTIIVFVVYKYRWYIAYWAYKSKAKRSSPEMQPLLDSTGAATREGGGYDGYVIYNYEDFKFVHNDLRQLLEVQLCHKLHIWERDVCAGQDKVSAIADAIYASEHVVAVISEQVLDDAWFQFQLNVALDRQLDLKRDFLILILLEDINYEKLDKFWCVMLTRLLCTRWCSDENNVKRRVFEQQLEQHFKHVGKPP